jgi:hypothetical protein
MVCFHKWISFSKCRTTGVIRPELMFKILSEAGTALSHLAHERIGEFTVGAHTSSQHLSKLGYQRAASSDPEQACKSGLILTRL